MMSGDWVTFIDSDDFIKNNYFDSIDKYVKKKENLYIVKPVTYVESEDFYDFHEKNSLSWVWNFEKYLEEKLNETFRIQRRVNNVFFHREMIGTERFDSVKTGEDWIFLLNIISTKKIQKMAFIKDTEYFYRKRIKKNSITDKYTNNEYYMEKIIIPQIEKFSENLNVDYIQYVIAYTFIPYYYRTFEKMKYLYIYKKKIHIKNKKFYDLSMFTKKFHEEALNFKETPKISMEKKILVKFNIEKKNENEYFSHIFNTSNFNIEKKFLEIEINIDEREIYDFKKIIQKNTQLSELIEGVKEVYVIGAGISGAHALFFAHRSRKIKKCFLISPILANEKFNYLDIQNIENHTAKIIVFTGNRYFNFENSLIILRNLNNSIKIYKDETNHLNYKNIYDSRKKSIEKIISQELEKISKIDINEFKVLSDYYSKKKLLKLLSEKNTEIKKVENNLKLVFEFLE